MKNKNNPNYNLYKFYKPTIDNVVDIMEKKLYLSKTSDFNDPFEGSILNNKEFLTEIFCDELSKNGVIPSQEILFELLIFEHSDDNLECAYEIINKYLKEKDYGFTIYVKEQYEKRVKQIKDEVDSYSVACFSKLNSSSFVHRLNLWAYYADDGKGFCVEYKLCDVNIKLSDKLHDVVYNSGVLKITKKSNLFALRLLKRKTETWEGEKEIRLIIKNDELSDHKISFPYAKTIFLGVNSSKSLQSLMRKIGEENNVPVYLMKIGTIRKKLCYEHLD